MIVINNPYSAKVNMHAQVHVVALSRYYLFQNELMVAPVCGFKNIVRPRFPDSGLLLLLYELVYTLVIDLKLRND